MNIMNITNYMEIAIILLLILTTILAIASIIIAIQVNRHVDNFSRTRKKICQQYDYDLKKLRNIKPLVTVTPIVNDEDNE